MDESPQSGQRITRRSFVAGSVATLSSAFASTMVARMPIHDHRPSKSGEPSRLEARATPPTGTIAPGFHKLGFARDRDGFVFVPQSYRASTPAPLLILLHGAGQSSAEWSRAPLETLLGPHNVIALVPDSRDATWDLGMGGYGPDVKFIDRALHFVYTNCNIDPKRIGTMGFSDGGSYSLSLGITNGDLFSGLIALSPGYMSPAASRGKPPIFVAHGTADRILPIDAASRTLVPALRRGGYDVTYVEFDGPHRIIVPIVTEAVDWFATGKKPADARPG